MTVTRKALSGTEQRPRFVAEAVRQLQADQRQWVWLSTDYTLTDASSVAQKVFNATSNGAIGVAKDTAYEIDGLYLINVTTSAAPTGGYTWGILLGGTATLSTSGSIINVQSKTGASALQAVNGVSIDGGALITRTAVTAATTSTSAQNVAIAFSGRINVLNAGTLIPQIQLSSTSGTGGTPKMQAGSNIRLHAIGHRSGKTQGPWS